jgi:hypothetical protein
MEKWQTANGKAIGSDHQEKQTIPPLAIITGGSNTGMEFELAL